MMNFTIDEEYLTTVSVKTYSKVNGDDIDQTYHRLKYPRSYIVSAQDHPKFQELRDKLEQLGYIKIQRNWCNGDTVLVPFTLNGHRFLKDDIFWSASAFGITLRVARKINNKQK